MSKMGQSGDIPNKKKSIFSIIKNSYVYRLFNRLFSTLCTIVLIFLIVLGAMMFYFNMQAKAAKERGENYNPPFGLYTIISGSMEPNVHVYDVVVATEVRDLSKIKVNDIITFISSWDLNYGTTVTHRVVSISKTENGSYQFTTKGDSNQSADGAVVTQENLIGKVVMRIPQLGKLQFFLSTKMGWFIVVFIPAMIIIIMDMIKIFKLRVLKVDITNIRDVEEADKTYFEDDYLDNRDLDDSKLNKTVVLSVPIDEKVKLVNSTKIKLKSDKNSVDRKPLKHRTDVPANSKKSKEYSYDNEDRTELLELPKKIKKSKKDTNKKRK